MDQIKGYPVTNIRTLCKMYGVGRELFKSWIITNPDLSDLLKPYRDRGARCFPPQVTKKIFEILGEP